MRSESDKKAENSREKWSESQKVEITIRKLSESGREKVEISIEK